jgi:hypothetical protein
MRPKPDSETIPQRPFLPSARAAAIMAALGLAALGGALYLRYFIIQYSGIGVTCEAGEESLTCKVRLAVIQMFVEGTFGWVAMITAVIQLWRPHVVVFAIGIVFTLLGLVLYNTRVSALSAALLVLSLARPWPAGR